MGFSRSRLLGLLVFLLGAAGAWPAVAAATPGTDAVAQLTGLSPSQISSAQACPPPARGGASCFAQVVVRAGTRTPVHLPRPAGLRPALTAGGSAAPAVEPAGTAAPQPGTAGWLQQAYDLSWLAANKGSGDTVAIVDAYGDPTIAGDLATFRSANGLPACTPASGCLTIVNENGGATPPSTSDSGWDTEQTLDVDAVSSLCPSCRILLIEANGADWSDLQTAVQTADALGANQISMSFGADGSPLPGTWAFPGVASLAAGGDDGYQGDWNDTVPATNPGVTAVGGTSLSVSAQSVRGFAESTWSLQGGYGTGSGCDLYEAKPAWQTDSGCTGRAWNDVSADADPNSGLNIYDTGDGGWEFVGGTSLATPLTAAYEAITAVNGTSPQWAYSDTGLLNDIVSGSSGSCTTEPAYVCNAGPGYDGPTGNGSISGDVVMGGPGIGGSSAPTTTSGTADVAGGVYPNGVDTTYWWEYGTTTSYGQQTAAQDIGSGSFPVSVEDVIGGLAPGTTYHFRLVAENADGAAYGPDATFTTAAKPTDLTAPSITGAAQQSETLTADPGVWSLPGTATYAWQRLNSGTWDDISGAAATTYTLTGDDVGTRVRVVVTETNPAGSTSAASASVGPVAPLALPQTITASATTSVFMTPAPAPAAGTTTPPPGMIAAPSLRGRAALGARISVAPGRYRDTSRHSVRYFRCTPRCRPVGRAGQSTYRLGAADAGAYIRAQVTLWGAGGVTTSWVPGLVGPVTSPNAGVAGLPLGHRALLRARRSPPLARAQAGGATAASRGISGRIRIRFARTWTGGGRVTVWACVLRSRVLIGCTPRRRLRRRLVLTVPLANGERVQVVALRRA